MLSVQVNLGDDLAFYGDFTEDSNNVLSAQSNGTDGPIQLGLLSNEDFIPLVTISDSVSFVDPAKGSNADLEFSVTGDIVTFQIADGPTVSLFEGLASDIIRGIDLTNGDEGGSSVPLGPDILSQSVGPDASLAFSPDRILFADSIATGGTEEVWFQGPITIDVLGVDGSVRTDFDGNPIFVAVNQGSVDGFAATLDGDINLGGVGFDVKQLTVSYATSENTLAITGATDFLLEGSAVDINWGGGSTTGLMITGTKLSRLDMVVTASITNLLGLDIDSRSSDPIRIDDDTSDTTFSMSGEISVSTHSGDVLDKIDAIFGDSTSNSPGLVI